MAEIGRWGGHKFEVSAEVVRSFTGLTIKGSSETEDKTSSKQKYVSRKNGKPVEISLTAHLSAFLGCDVRAEALAFVDHARAGKTDYFYVGDAKLVTCQLMLTDASVEEVEISGGNTWTRADVKLTMKQCSKNDGSSGSGSSGSGGSKKASTKTTSTKTTTKTTSKTTASGLVSAVVGAISGVAKTVASGLSAAQQYISSTVKKVQSVSTAAKKTSATKKTTTTSKNCVITTKKITRVGGTPTIKLNTK